MCIQKAIILPFILLTLVQVASATAQTVPPPLPESAWVNRTTLNYTELHDKYAADLLCMNYPTGVYGFYYGWIILLSMVVTFNAVAFSEGMQLQGHFFPELNIPSSLPPSAFSLFLLHRNIRAFYSCEIYSLNTVIHQSGIMNNFAAGLWAAGSMFFLMRSLYFIVSGDRTRSGMAVTLLGPRWLGAAILMQTFSIGTNYIGILSSLNINVMKPDTVNPGAQVAIFVPFGIIMALWNLVGLASWLIGDGTVTGFSLICRLVVTAVAIMMGVFHGIGALRIGNIIGDPWGGSIMDAVVVCTVPVLQLLLLKAAKWCWMEF